MKKPFRFKNILKYGRIIFPVIALVLAAGAVVLALNIREDYMRKQEELAAAELIEQQQQLQNAEPEETKVPLETNEDPLIEALMNDYYSYLSSGDMTALSNICDNLSESESIRLEEQSKYLGYSINELYYQAGLEEGTYVVYAYCYVTFDEFPDMTFPAYNGFYIKSALDGSLYIVKGDLTDEENEYISKVASEDDVIELNNVVTVEYNEMVLAFPEILDYLIGLDEKVSNAVGERLAALNTDIVDPNAGADGEDGNGDSQDSNSEDEVPAVIFVTAISRVNVRASDSTSSEKIGEAMEGDTFEVIEVLDNGWTKIVFNDGEGYISSDFLTTIQSADSLPTIGMLKANEEVNVRSKPSASSERLGALVKGDQLEITAIVDGWCEVKYNGRIAYVIIDFVEYTLFE